MRFLITGGAGFIGSTVVRHLMANTADHVLVVDKLTYAGSLASLETVMANQHFTFLQADIAEAAAMGKVIESFQPDVIMNLAAESHVDRSIDGPGAFIKTNIVGTFTLLEAALSYWRHLPSSRRNSFRFHHISTDEVYGALGPSGFFNENSAYSPNSPYAATKASSDHLVKAWGETYGLPILISNCSNNYGPYQFPEKLIPRTIIRALRNETIEVYGSGTNVRDWLYVDDHVEALLLIAKRARPGSQYIIGGNAERTNLDVVTAICERLDILVPMPKTHKLLIEHVSDRPGHDHRYAVDATRIKFDLGWKSHRSFERSLDETVRWFLNNRSWWTQILEHIPQSQTRLGKITP